MSIIYQFDSFTDSTYKQLENHSGETACDWKRQYTVANPNRNLISPSNRLFRSAYNSSEGNGCINGSEHFTSSNPLSVADYVVSTTLIWLGDYGGSGIATDRPTNTGNPPLDAGASRVNGSDINETGLNNCPYGTLYIGDKFEIYGRMSGGFSGYSLQYVRSTSTWRLCQVDLINNTRSILASWIGPLNSSGSLIQLSLKGSKLEGWIDNVKQLSATISIGSSGTYTGLRFDGGSSPIRGLHIDNFQVDNNFPGLDTPIITAIGGANVNFISLSWTNIGAASYNVYRLNENTGTYTLYQTLSGTSSRDYRISVDIFYFYYVVGIASNGTLSDPSNVTSAKITRGGILSMATSRASIYQGIQIGIETTPGVLVPTTKRIGVLDMNQVPMIPIKTNNVQSGRGAASIQRGQQYTETKYSGAADFNIFPYLFSLCYGVKTPILANAGYTWIWNPSSTDPEIPTSATIEEGSVKGAEKFGYATVQDIQLKWSKEDCSIDGTIFGQKQLRNITMTPQNRMTTSAAASSATTLTVATSLATGTIPVGTYKTNLGKTFTVTAAAVITAGSATLTVTALPAAITAGEIAFLIPEIPAAAIDPTTVGIYVSLDGVNWTQLLDTIDGQINLNAMWSPSFHVNDTIDTFDRLIDRDPNITATLTTEEGTEADNWFADIMSGTKVWLGFRSTGQILNASPLVKQLFRLEAPFFVTKPEPGDKNDVYGNTFSFDSAHDQAYGIFKVTVITNFGTL